MLDRRQARRIATVLAELEGEPRPRHVVSAAINVTPLVDVVLVLLIIFMVVTPLLQGKIELPQVLGAEPYEPATDDLKIGLDSLGGLTVDGEPTSLEQLGRALETAGVRNTARWVSLEADRAVPFGKVRAVLGVLRDTSRSEVGFATKPVDPSTPPEAEPWP